MTLDPAALRAALDHHLPAALGLLREWVGINSHTSNPHGVNALATATAAAFAPLGFTAESVPCSGENCGHHLFLRRPGAARAKLLCVSHLDTVFSSEEEHRNHFHWREAEGRIYGPGTVDIKGGTALLWLQLRALRDAAPALFEHFGWAVGLNAAEETLGDDFAQLALARFGDRAAAALVYEAGARANNTFTFVIARKGRSLFRVAVAGRGAHAGSRHDDGANAITELGRLIPILSSLTNPARGLTANVGFVRGGEGLNRVAQHAEVEGELRAYDPAALAEAENTILALAGPGSVAAVKDGFRCHVTADISGRTSAWPDNPGTRGLLDTYARAAARVGFSVVSEQRGGLSDGNFLAPFLPTIDGLGPDGGNAHASEWSDDPSAPKRPEYLDPSSLVPKALLNTLAIGELAESLG
jgi:glutamate carboxypeptidase